MSRAGGHRQGGHHCHSGHYQSVLRSRVGVGGTQCLCAAAAARGGPGAQRLRLGASHPALPSSAGRVAPFGHGDPPEPKTKSRQETGDSLDHRWQAAWSVSTAAGLQRSLYPISTPALWPTKIGIFVCSSPSWPRVRTGHRQVQKACPNSLWKPTTPRSKML